MIMNIDQYIVDYLCKKKYIYEYQIIYVQFRVTNITISYFIILLLYFYP